MPLKPADKAKIAAVAGLLLILPLGALLVYWEWPTDSQPDAVPSAAAPAAPTVGFPYADTRRFFRLVQSDDIQQATAMLAKNAALTTQKRTPDGATPLHVVRSVAMAKLLLDNGADINARDLQHSATAARWLANRLLDQKPATRELIQFLRSKGAAEPDIYFAAAVGDVGQMEKLLAADPSLIDKPSDKRDVMFGGIAPLQIAAYTGQFDSAKFLVDHGADVRNRGGWHNTESVEKAAYVGNAEIVSLLCDHGATVDTIDKDFAHSPLCNSAQMGHADVVKVLLAHGAVSSPKLISEVRSAMRSNNPPGDGDPPSGTADEYQQVLSMLSAIPATQTSPPGSTKAPG